MGPTQGTFSLYPVLIRTFIPLFGYRFSSVTFHASNHFHPSLCSASSYLAPSIFNFEQCLFFLRPPLKQDSMETSGLTNVLRLLLAQNNLPITGSREQLVERLGSITPPPLTQPRPHRQPNDLAQTTSNLVEVAFRRSPAILRGRTTLL